MNIWTSDDQKMGDMWNYDQCTRPPYRTHRRQVSAWLNNFWRAHTPAASASAPWTWTKGNPLHVG